MHTLGAVCGELLLIDPVTLKLQDLSAINLKIINLRGKKFIPRSVQIRTYFGVYTANISIVGISNLYDQGLIINPSRRHHNLRVNDQHNSKRNQRSHSSSLTDLVPSISPVSNTVVTPAATEKFCLNSSLNLFPRKTTHHGKKKRKSRRKVKKTQKHIPAWRVKLPTNNRNTGNSVTDDEYSPVDIDEPFTDPGNSKPSFSLSIESELDCDICQTKQNPSPNIQTIINHLQVQIPTTISPYLNLLSLLKPQKLPPILPTPIQTLSHPHQVFNPKFIVPNWIVQEVNRLFNIGNIICSSFECLPNHTKRFLLAKVSVDRLILKPSNWCISSTDGVRKDFAVHLVYSDNNDK